MSPVDLGLSIAGSARGTQPRRVRLVVIGVGVGVDAGAVSGGGMMTGVGVGAVDQRVVHTWGRVVLVVVTALLAGAVLLVLAQPLTAAIALGVLAVLTGLAVRSRSSAALDAVLLTDLLYLAVAVGLPELRAAIAGGDAARFLAAVTGRDIDDALQQVWAGIPIALKKARKQAEPVALSVINRLTWRAGEGDEVLAEDLLAQLRGEPLNGRVVPVDLDMLSTELEGDLSMSTGGYVDLRTGQVYDDDATDPMMVGQDAVIDVDAKPDRWLRFGRTGSRDGWQDMAAFAERQRDAGLRERLERAIEGRGAFRRFRDLVAEEDLAEQWYVFAGDRQQGRARCYLAAEGIRVG